MKTAALIPAAGRGERLGKGHKALVEVAGKTLLERSLEAFLTSVDEVVIAVSDDMFAASEAIVRGRAKLVLGGSSRQASVFALLEATDAEIVLIHDAARPFLSKTMIASCIASVKEVGAATVAKPVADSLIMTVDGTTVDRDELSAVQTPQGFKRDLIVKAHLTAMEGNISATDDAGLVRAINQPVAVVTGNNWLMKVTTPEDLEIANALAATWDAAQKVDAC